MKSSKYGAKKITVDGFVFASKIEASRYTFLRAQQIAGFITGLELQPRFELVPGFKVLGKAIRPMSYVADFRYTNQFGRVIIEDVKGFKTEAYRCKIKMFLYRYCRHGEIAFFEITKHSQEEPLNLEEI